jgi:hypothetical protein
MLGAGILQLWLVVVADQNAADNGYGGEASGAWAQDKCVPYLARGKPAKKTALINSSDHAIVATIGSEYRGVAQYYLLAGDVFRLHRLQWVMQTSMPVWCGCGQSGSELSVYAARVRLYRRAMLSTAAGSRLPQARLGHGGQHAWG